MPAQLVPQKSLNSWNYNYQEGTAMPQLKYGPECGKDNCTTTATWGITGTEFPDDPEVYACGNHLIHVIKNRRFDQEETMNIRELWC